MALFAAFAAVLLVVAFALVLGAQAFDTFVNVPTIFSDPPQSIERYMTWETAKRVPLYFVRTAVLVLVAGVLAIIAAILNRAIVLGLAGACGLLYIALLFVIFIPENRKLGFLPGGTKATSPDEIAGLARDWQAWNIVRLFLQAAGLIAAAVSLYLLKW